MISWWKNFGLLVTCVLTCVACNESKVDVEPPQAEEALLELPVEPLTESEVTFFPVGVFEPDAPMELSSQILNLAIGDVYPDTLTISPKVTLGCGPVGGTLTIDDVTSRGRAVEIVQEGTDQLRLRAVTAGETTASITGTLEFAEGDLDCWQENQDLAQIPVEMKLEVRATQVAGAKLQSCDGSQHIAMELGARIDALVLPTDAEGEAFAPSNAVRTRAVPIRVLGDVSSLEILEGDDTSKATVANVFLPPTESSLYLHTPYSEPIRIDAISPNQVTEPNVSFITVRGYEDPLVLEDGATYDETELERRRDRVFPIVSMPSMAGQTTYCSPLAPELFAFETSTPDVCEAESVEWTDYIGFKLLDFSSEYIGHAAHVKADGACSMRLSADSLAGGAGWSRSLDVSFTGTETLEEMLDDPTR